MIKYNNYLYFKKGSLRGFYYYIRKKRFFYYFILPFFIIFIILVLFLLIYNIIYGTFETNIYETSRYLLLLFFSISMAYTLFNLMKYLFKIKVDNDLYDKILFIVILFSILSCVSFLFIVILICFENFFVNIKMFYKWKDPIISNLQIFFGINNFHNLGYSLFKNIVYWFFNITFISYRSSKILDKTN